MRGRKKGKGGIGNGGTGKEGVAMPQKWEGRGGEGGKKRGEEGGEGRKVRTVRTVQKSKNTPRSMPAYAPGNTIFHHFSSCSSSLLFSFSFPFSFTEVQLRSLEETVSSQASQGVWKQRRVAKAKENAILMALSPGKVVELVATTFLIFGVVEMST